MYYKIIIFVIHFDINDMRLMPFFCSCIRGQCGLTKHARKFWEHGFALVTSCTHGDTKFYVCCLESGNMSLVALVGISGRVTQLGFTNNHGMATLKLHHAWPLEKGAHFPD